MNLKHTIIAYDNGGDDSGFGKENEEFIKKTHANLKENLGLRLPIAPKNLESGDVGLKFQLKMFEFMKSINQKSSGTKKGRPDKTK